MSIAKCVAQKPKRKKYLKITAVRFGMRGGFGVDYKTYSLLKTTS